MCHVKSFITGLFVVATLIGCPVFASALESNPIDSISVQSASVEPAVPVFQSSAPLIKGAFSSGLSYIEYLYGVSSYAVNLIQIDHPAGEVSSTSLFPTNVALYGAADSDDSNYFWATSRGDLTYGLGSNLYKVYPGEKAVVKIGDGYGLDPDYPTDPNYAVHMRELAFVDDTSTLYGTDYEKLYSINTTTGLATYLGDFGVGQDGKVIDQVWSMGYDSQTSTLFIVNQQLDDTGFTRIGTQMYSVNPATAAVTYIGDTGSMGMTDIYESHQSNLFYGIKNLENEVFDIDTSTSAATSLGAIGNNLLGLGGDFTEVAGPQVWLGSSSSMSITASAYSELDGQTASASDNDRSGFSVSATANAFVQESGQSTGIGQDTTMTVNGAVNTTLTEGVMSFSIDFDSVYNGPNDHGRGGGTATVNWFSYVRAIEDEVTYFDGDRIIILVDGSQLLNDQISQYITDWELKIHDESSGRNALLLTEEDVPALASTPFLGAFHAVVGYSYNYRVDLTFTLDIDMLAGDISADGKVNMTDYALLGGQWQATGCDGTNGWCNGADVDESGDVGLDDLAQVATDWIKGNVWDDDNEFSQDLSFTFRSIALPETPQMLNDDCADALDILADTEYFGSTETATGTDITSCASNDIYDVWYNFVPQQDGLYKVHVESTDSFSACVSIFDSCGGSEVHCWAPGSEGRFFEASAWTSYLIRLADYGGSTGDFKLVVVYYPPPANDDCANAIAVGLDEYYQGETYGATSDGTSSCGTDDTADVWYQYTASESGNVVFKVESHDWDSPFFSAAVFDGCGGSELGCAVYAGGEEPTTVLVLGNAVQGQTYYVRVAREDDSYGEFSLYVEPGPENDACSNAESISVWSSAEGSTMGATGTDLSSCGSNDSRDIWYELTSTENQVVVIRVYDGDYSGKTFTGSLFSSCGGSAFELQCAESSGDGIEEPAIAQLVYAMSTNDIVYIRLAYDDGQMGRFEIEVVTTELPDNDDCGDAQVIDPMESYAEGSTLGVAGIDENGCGTGDTHDVWFTFTPDTTGDYDITLYQMEGPFAGTITVYDGSSCSPLPTTELVCEEMFMGEWDVTANDVALTASQTYLIRVGSSDAGQGDFGIDIYGGGGPT